MDRKCKKCAHFYGDRRRKAFCNPDDEYVFSIVGRCPCFDKKKKTVLGRMLSRLNLIFQCF